MTSSRSQALYNANYRYDIVNGQIRLDGWFHSLYFPSEAICIRLLGKYESK